MHLTAALGISEAVQSLVRRSQANTKIWSTRDGDSECNAGWEIIGSAVVMCLGACWWVGRYVCGMVWDSVWVVLLLVT